MKLNEDDYERLEHESRAVARGENTV
jgi:hypothetical protein